MNRNLLKWILIAVVILGAAGYLILSEMPSGKKSSHPKGKKEQVVTGHSKAFKIEPVEGITISAPKNALDKNREFKLTPVDDKTYEKVVEQLQGQQDVKPLMVFELDAGLKPDAFLPGNYHVEIDLDQIGIPRSLQEKVVVYRGADYDRKNTLYYMYDARLNNGKFSFKSNQNSKLVLGLRHRPESSLTTGASMFLKNPVRVFVEGMSTIESLGKIHYFDRLYFYFANPEDHISILVKHESGDFRLHFLFSDTEDSNRFYKYLANDKAFGKRIEELEQEAHLQYEAKVQVAVNKQGLNDAWWDIFSKKQVDAIRERINEEEIFDELVKKDLKNGELAKLQADPDGKLPKSIETIIHQIIRANEFLNASGFSSSNTVLQVALMKGVMDAEGTAVKYWFEDAGFVNINYSSYFDDSKGPDAIQCTLVHELCHIRQKYYYAYFKMSRAGEEATAVVLERDAAKLWYKQGILGKHHDPESRSVVSQLLTARPVPYIFGYPIDKLPSMDDDKSYTMADAIEGIREGVGKDDVTMSSFLDSYLQYGPSAKGWKDWIQHSLAIDDGQFRKGWVYFAERLIPLVFESQCGGQCPKEVTTTVLKISRSNPVAKLERLSKPQDYTINTFRVNITDAIESTDKMPSVFVHCKTKGESNPYVTFYWSDSKFQEYLSKKRVGGELLEYTERVAPSPNFVWNCATDFTLYDNGTKKTNSKKVANQYQLATVTTTQSEGPKGDYRVVALFPPEKLKIRKAKEDQITFIVPKAPRALTKEKLITGAVVTYKDNKGNVVTRDIQPKDFGRKATWSIVGCTKPGNGFSLSMHWYYRVDEQTVYESPESEPVTWGSKGDQPEEETRPIQEPKTNYWKQVGGRMKTENTSIDKGESIDDEEVSSDYRSIELQAAQTGRSLDFTGMGATEEKTKENGHVYVKDIFIEGTLTYTEPPKFWTPAQQYKARWEIADDPYLTKVKDPFVFEAKNTSSNQAACTQSKKDKIDTGHSTTGKVNWLRSASTTFEARFPEKDGPKFFTLTQTYSIKEREGSNLMATVTFEYDYEWIGEPEEEEKEEETAPEGGCWKLVKIETDDSHKHFKAEDIYGDKNRTTATISGGSGSYSMHVDWWGALTNGKQFTGENGFIFKIDRQFHGGTPKQYYTPGKNFNLSWVSEELMVESLIKEMPFNAKSFDHYPNGSLSLLGYDSYLLRKTNNRIACDAKHTPDRMEMNLGVVPAKEAYPKGFVICEVVVLDYPSAAAPGCYINNYYIYEWVDGKQKEQDLGNLGIGIEFPMNAKDKAYFGEHGGSLLHRNDFGVKIPSGSYSVKKSGKGYILEGSGHHEGSRPRASHSIEVRIVLDKNKIPVEASFSCQGFYEGTIRTMKTETTTFQATGTAKLTEKELGPNSRMGKCTSFNGIIHTESEGDFDYSNTEGGHLTIRWKCD